MALRNDKRKKRVDRTPESQDGLRRKPQRGNSQPSDPRTTRQSRVVRSRAEQARRHEIAEAAQSGRRARVSQDPEFPSRASVPRRAGNQRGTTRGTKKDYQVEIPRGARSQTLRTRDSYRQTARSQSNRAQNVRGQRKASSSSSSATFKARSGDQVAKDVAENSTEFSSSTVRELRQKDRAKKAKKTVRRYVLRVVLIAVLAVGVVGGGIAVYNSSLFSVENVTVSGVEHLTTAEMTQLANVPADTTLLRIDTDTIANRVKASAWVDEVHVNRIFPNTIELDVTEREVAAIVEIPTSSKSAVKSWAIAKDRTWLMPIPEPDSEAAKTTSAKIYEDAENVLHIVDVPYGTKAEIGEICTDANVNNALDIVSGMTTELADQVVKVSAAGTAETTLVLENGVEVAFGKAEDIRDKERVVLEILAQNPDNVSYINVRMVETPTWRAI